MSFRVMTYLTNKHSEKAIASQIKLRAEHKRSAPLREAKFFIALFTAQGRCFDGQN
jgi:hypothetical protein